MIELLPDGEFILKRKSGVQMHGRFCYWGFLRFCELKGIGDSWIEFQKFFISGMGPVAFGQFIHCAVQAWYKEKKQECAFNQDDVEAWMEEAVIFKDEQVMANILGHAMYLFPAVVTDEEGQKKSQRKKKKN